MTTLIEQGILPSPKTSPALHEQRQKLERAKIGNRMYVKCTLESMQPHDAFIIETKGENFLLFWKIVSTFLQHPVMMVPISILHIKKMHCFAGASLRRVGSVKLVKVWKSLYYRVTTLKWDTQK